MTTKLVHGNVLKNLATSDTELPEKVKNMYPGKGNNSQKH
jgi:hypothetical protein